MQIKIIFLGRIFPSLSSVRLLRSLMTRLKGHAKLPTKTTCHAKLFNNFITINLTAKQLKLFAHSYIKIVVAAFYAK